MRKAILPLGLLSLALVAQSPLNGEFRIDLARAHYYTGKQAEAEADYRGAFARIKIDLRGLYLAAFQSCLWNRMLERWLGGESVEHKVLVADLEAAVARGHFYPVLPVAALTGLGLSNLLELLTAAFPSPLEHPLPVVTAPDGRPRAPLTCDPDGPLVAEVVKEIQR